MTPASGAGTSMLALSVSRVRIGSSLRTVRPGCDVDFDDRHILEVADVGDLDFVRHACLLSGRVTELRRMFSSEAREMAHEAARRGAVDHPVVIGQA